MSAVPVQKPIIVTRPKAQPQLRVEQGTKSSVATVILVKSAIFCGLTLSAFFASSLTGQVMLEKARIEGIHAIERSKAATKEDALLRGRVQALTSSSAIDSWATQNHFIPPEGLVAQSDSASENTQDAQAKH
jgi:hypothetical protein